MNRENLLDIARSGILAPSADNCHAIQFEYSDSAISIWPDSARAAITEKHRQVLGLISVGAVVENMQLRSTQLGYSAQVSWFPLRNSALIARIDFSDDHETQPDPLAAAVPDRHTNRRFYDGPTLTTAEMGALSAEAEMVGGVRVMWLHGALRHKVQKLVRLAESERFSRERLHRELYSSIRFDLDWQQTAEESLPLGSLEVEVMMRPLFKALRSWPLMRALNMVGAHHLLGLRTGYVPCWQAPSLGLVLTTQPIESGAIAAGRGFERLWLRATLLELAIQPLAAATVLTLQSDADDAASLDVRTTLADGWKQIAPHQTPVLVFRIGRAHPPSVRTARRSIESYSLPSLTSEIDSQVI